MDYIKFFFGDFWHWLGGLIFLVVIVDGVFVNLLRLLAGAINRKRNLPDCDSKGLPTWKKGTPPHKGWWITKTTHEDGNVLIGLEPFTDDKWPHEGNDNVMYMDMNDLKYLPEKKEYDYDKL